MKKILEIGSGQGFHAFVLSKNKKNIVTGIDFSKNDIAVSRKRYPNVEFMVMNAEHLKFSANTFDEIYALDVLEHVDSLSKVIKEIRRVLKKGGLFVINIPHYKSEAYLIKIRPTYFKEIHHVRVFKENELDKILKANKFRISAKKRKGFLNHIELIVLLKRNIESTTQLSIGSWRDSYFTKALHVIMLYFDNIVIHTPLVYFPLWVVTIPIGKFISLFGNQIFPKSFYYEAIKK